MCGEKPAHHGAGGEGGYAEVVVGVVGDPGEDLVRWCPVRADQSAKDRSSQPPTGA
ncbi:hypothetical protein ACIRYZ_13625 [Kitasatospora sp. NPDC101155]|uniref:hypothetical protein n=1 Tax=Kitasatospora sp. NPDC101155 TaxID=3364097 RepID=UPI003825A5C4